jgi:biopolymer transport protein ExbD
MVRQAHHDSGDTAVLAEINITPFTDVLLVLLIIFMILAALVVPPGFEQRLDNCNCPYRVPPHQSKPIDVTVMRSGAVFVEGKPTSVGALYPLLGQMHARDSRAKISLISDSRAPYGLVIRVLDAAKAANITGVSFVTQ